MVMSGVNASTSLAEPPVAKPCGTLNIVLSFLKRYIFFFSEVMVTVFSFLCNRESPISPSCNNRCPFIGGNVIYLFSYPIQEMSSMRLSFWDSNKEKAQFFLECFHFIKEESTAESIDIVASFIAFLLFLSTTIPVISTFFT